MECICTKSFRRHVFKMRKNHKDIGAFREKKTSTAKDSIKWDAEKIILFENKKNLAENTINKKKKVTKEFII